MNETEVMARNIHVYREIPISTPALLIGCGAIVGPLDGMLVGIIDGEDEGEWTITISNFAS
jgi:hypothetical protein